MRHQGTGLYDIVGSWWIGREAILAADPLFVAPDVAA